MTWLARIASLLGVAKWSRVLLFALALSLASAAGAFWLGSDWQAGRTARSELKTIQAMLDERELQAADVRALRREFAAYRQQQQDAERQRWAQLAAWLATPGLGDVPALDARGIELWNAANAGTAAAPTRPATAGAVPAAAPSASGIAGRGDGQGTAAKPSSGNGAGP